MAYRSDENTSEGFLEGKLLIALPGIGDPRFERSVIYMCAHSSEGAMGLIINKPIEGLDLRELLSKLDIGVTSDKADGPVLFGGPVETGRGFVLHSADYSAGETMKPVAGSNIALTGTLDILRAIAHGHGPKKLLFALGYADWGAGQIESEILANGWIHCDADERILFDCMPGQKWQEALSKLGANPSGLSSEAGRA
jgi:putative transcriptional regulator